MGSSQSLTEKLCNIFMFHVGDVVQGKGSLELGLRVFFMQRFTHSRGEIKMGVGGTEQTFTSSAPSTKILT